MSVVVVVVVVVPPLGSHRLLSPLIEVTDDSVPVRLPNKS